MSFMTFMGATEGGEFRYFFGILPAKTALQKSLFLYTYSASRSSKNVLYREMYRNE